MIALQIHGLRVLVQDHAPLRILRRLGSRALIGLGMGRDLTEVLLGDRHSLRRINIAHHRHDHVRWNVVGLEEALCIACGKAV